MKKTHLRRSLAAVATALACLAVMATPAAAVTHDADVTGGQLTFSKSTFTYVEDLLPTSCVDPTLDLDVTGTSVSVTDLDMVTHDFMVPTVGTNSFLAVVTRSTTGNTAGTLTGTTLSPMRVAFVVTHYNTSGCTPTGTPICTSAFILQLSGTLTGTGVSDTFSLTGTSVGTTVAFPTCTAGPSFHTIGFTVVTTSAITGHLTS